MASRTKKRESSKRDDGKKAASEMKIDCVQNGGAVDSTSALGLGHGSDVRAAVLDIIGKGENIMQSILQMVSETIVEKLLGSKSFVSKLTESLLEVGVVGIYDACKMDIECVTERAEHTSEFLRARLERLETINMTLQNELDELEQYGRRNSLLFRGIPETEKDTTEAVLTVCHDIDSQYVDRSHRLGQIHEDTTRKPRPIIVKFTSNGPRNDISKTKRKLKGSKTMITENRIKRRNELLKKMRDMRGITASWSIDGRIVCLPGKWKESYGDQRGPDAITKLLNRSDVSENEN